MAGRKTGGVNSQATPGSITEPNLACEIEIELATYALGQRGTVYDPGLRADPAVTLDGCGVERL